ncbi:hotdog fold thioesterase [Microbacterium fluvii]
MREVVPLRGTTRRAARAALRLSGVMEDDSIWFGGIEAAQLNENSRSTLNENLGIEITAIEADRIVGRMPVDHRTIQPAGVLHGGASVAFAETLASWGGYLTVDPARFHVVGQEINANHVRPARDGTWVTGVATPVHLGRRAQVWDIRITDEAGKLVCISRCTLAAIAEASGYAPPEQRSR